MTLPEALAECRLALMEAAGISKDLNPPYSQEILHEVLRIAGEMYKLERYLKEPPEQRPDHPLDLQ